VCGLLVAAGLIILACAQETSPVGPGEECFVASDCRPGLVCVPQRGGARQCSDDLSQVTGRPPSQPNGDSGDNDASDDGPPVEDGPVQEAGDPDTGNGGNDAAVE
jgi:hypothetical protein